MDTKKKTKEKGEREPNRVKVLHQIGFSSYTFVVKGVGPSSHSSGVMAEEDRVRESDADGDKGMELSESAEKLHA